MKWPTVGGVDQLTQPPHNPLLSPSWPLRYSRSCWVGLMETDSADVPWPLFLFLFSLHVLKLPSVPGGEQLPPGHCVLEDKT